MTAVTSINPYQPPPEPGRPETARAYEGEFGFWDLVDVVNPLQHIPVVNWAYRGLTGDTIQPPARIAGAGLYGGPIGVAGAIADEALAEHSGRHAHQHVLGWVGLDEPATPGSAPGTVPRSAPTVETGPMVAEGPLPGTAPSEVVQAAAVPVAPAGEQAAPGVVALAEGPVVADAPAIAERLAVAEGPAIAEGPSVGGRAPASETADRASATALAAIAPAAAGRAGAGSAAPATVSIAEGPIVGGDIRLAEGPAVSAGRFYDLARAPGPTGDGGASPAGAQSVAPGSPATGQAALPRPDAAEPGASGGGPSRADGLRFYDLGDAPRRGFAAPAAAPRPPSGPVVADSRMDAALAALAARSSSGGAMAAADRPPAETPAVPPAVPPAGTATASAPPVAEPPGTAGVVATGHTGPQRGAAPAGLGGPGAIPPAAVPHAMAEALARYHATGASAAARRRFDGAS